jgi:hypothetical protein
MWLVGRTTERAWSSVDALSCRSEPGAIVEAPASMVETTGRSVARSHALERSRSARRIALRGRSLPARRIA